MEEKVLGYGKYPDDWYLPGMTYGSAVRSQYPRARVLGIDTSRAKALPGVVAVITAADIPGENKVGHIKHDQYSLIPIGGQLICSIPAAFLLKGSKIGAVLGTFITNQITVFFIYPVQCYAGAKLLGLDLSYGNIKSMLKDVVQASSFSEPR